MKTLSGRLTLIIVHGSIALVKKELLGQMFQGSESRTSCHATTRESSKRRACASNDAPIVKLYILRMPENNVSV